MDNKLLQEGLKSLDLAELSNAQLKQFNQYLELLQEWNQKINLTAIDQADEIVIKHFLDSLSCLQLFSPQKGDKVIDIGTGGGFPGLPLKIVEPKIELVLLEAVRKKLFFLEELCYKLDLSEVSFIHGRAEKYGQLEGYRENFDWAVARAVAELNILVEYTLPFVKVGGHLLVQKAKQAKDELIKAREAIKLLGGEIKVIRDFTLPFSGAKRYLIKIEKIDSTPDKYPRRIGKPRKDPL